MSTTTSKVQVSDTAPDFTLPSSEGRSVSLKDFLGKKAVVLYFYPKDDIPGCTAEACSFRDANHEMQKRGIVVLGVSADNLSSHQKFVEKYGLPFPLLADTDIQRFRSVMACGKRRICMAKSIWASIVKPS